MESDIRLRSYQTEMVEESLKRNIIVAMDTGSGKTHIALARTRIELLRCGPEKLVWFLAPTVILCNQHFKTFTQNLPAFSTRLLTGAENVDTWTEQRVWDAALLNIRIVISTYDVLKDAMKHGFVGLSRLALLVVDEAHHCIKDGAVNQIMRDFYHPARLTGDQTIPAVLGLSASPVFNASKRGLGDIERNLNSMVVLPKTHRTDFLKYVYRPILQRRTYASTAASLYQSRQLLSVLDNIYIGYDIYQDPYVLDLTERMRKGDPGASRQLEKVLTKESTYTREQLKLLTARAHDISEQLGASAAEQYVEDCINKFDRLASIDSQWGIWSDKETTHLKKILQPLLTLRGSGAPPVLSAKVRCVLEILRSEFDHTSRGLVFVEQRAVVAALTRILAEQFDATSNIYAGAFVGMSQSSKRKGSIIDILETRGQGQALEDFRAGALNLLICTSVLEEGIDVSDCDVVICFDMPRNLKSFIQRRGRARKQQSKYIILMPDDSPEASSSKWSQHEQQMKEQYENDLREVKLVEEQESLDEQDDYVLYSSNTGARITTADAVAHLYHFCATLNTGQYVDSRPEFSFEVSKRDGVKWIKAVVTLPLAVDADLRRAESGRVWKTERHARKDAAFQAYCALYKAGLISDNMLPLRHAHPTWPDFNSTDQSPSMREVRDTRNVWLPAVQAMQQRPVKWTKTLIVVHTDTSRSFEITLLTPARLAPISPYSLYWNSTTTYTAEHHDLGEVYLSDADISALRELSRHLYRVVSNWVPSFDREDFFVLVSLDGSTSATDTQAWLREIQGFRPAAEAVRDNAHKLDQQLQGLIRIPNEIDKIYLLREVQSFNYSVEDELRQGYTLIATKFPKRQFFLTPIRAHDKRTHVAYVTPVPLDASICTIDRLSSASALMMVFLPSIIGQIEKYMLADLCRREILPPGTCDNLDLIRTAITSTSASDIVSYERLEFLGDCLLKLCTSITLLEVHPNWPESYLTAEKGVIVSNGNLAKASLAAGLDNYIVRGNVGSMKRPRISCNEVFERRERELTPQPQSNLSTKTLADVIESLLGLAYVEGGLENVLTYLKKLLPNQQHEWPDSMTDAYSRLWVHTQDAHPSVVRSTAVEQLEKLIGHHFSSPTLLLEAVTHASYQQPLNLREEVATVASYQRLEFLGDAVLDFIVSRRLYSYQYDLPPKDMHTYRTSVVNADILAFLAFEHSIPDTLYDIVTEPSTGGTRLEETIRTKSLWQFMRHSSHDLAVAQRQVAERHIKNRSTILETLKTGSIYPWYDVLSLSADKSFSDMVESVIGAIFVDTRGSYSACEEYVKRLGVLDLLDRLVYDKVDCVHPKEKVGMLAHQNYVTYMSYHEADRTNEEPALIAKACSTVPSTDKKRTVDLTDTHFKPTAPSMAQRTHVARIFINGNPVGEPVHGCSHFAARTLAALRACVILRRELKKKPGQKFPFLTPDDAFLKAKGISVVAEADEGQQEETADMIDSDVDLDDAIDDDMDDDVMGDQRLAHDEPIRRTPQEDVSTADDVIVNDEGREDEGGVKLHG